MNLPCDAQCTSELVNPGGQEGYCLRQPSLGFSLWKGREPVLTRLDLEITERCNNNCAHCYINLPSSCLEAQERELTTVELREIMKEAVSLGCLTVRMTGGEPLLRDDFEELYLCARKLGLKVLISTNATLITPDIAALLARIPPLEKIEITLYGMSEESYERSTGTIGSYSAARHGVELLVEKNVPFIVKSALFPWNRDELETFETWALTLPGMDTAPGYAMSFDLRGRRDSEEKNRLIQLLRPAPVDILWLLGRRREDYLSWIRGFAPKFMGHKGDSLFSCGAGVAGGCVDAYGLFQPCLLLRHPSVVYDLRNGSLHDALTRFFPAVRTKRATDARYVSRCARCFLRGLCEQCPAKSWAEHGTLDTPVEYCCEIAHTQARFVGLLYENENAWEVADWSRRVAILAEGSLPSRVLNGR